MVMLTLPIESMYDIYGNIYHQYTPNVGIYTIHGSYGLTLVYEWRVEILVCRHFLNMGFGLGQ